MTGACFTAFFAELDLVARARDLVRRNFNSEARTLSSVSQARDLVRRDFYFVWRARDLVRRGFSFVWRARDLRHFLTERDSVARAFVFV